MPTRQARSSSVTLRAAKPQAGLRDAYAKKLRALVLSMSQDVAEAVKEAYEANEPLIAQDAKALPAKKLSDIMDRLRKRWDERFNGEARNLAQWFAKKVRSGVVRQQKEAIKSAKDLPPAFSVGFDKGRVSQDVFEAIVEENALLIKSIGRTYLDQVEGLVMRSVTAGRDIKGLAEDLQKRYDITKRRADFIARDQNNKAAESLARAHDLNLGITRGVWMHVPGKYTSRKSHKDADGEEFDLNKGIWDNEVKKWVKPGELPGCQCTYRPILPKDLWKRKS